MATANKPSLDTLGEIFRFAVRRFRAARLAYGHGTTNARDEAAFLVLEALRLPIDRLDPYLDLKPTPAERARLLTLIDARVSLRLPAPYLVGAAYMHGVRFHADRRALIPRSFIGDMLADGVLPIGDPRKVRRVLDLCTGSGCLAILAALAFPRARIDAADLSAGALALARRNVSDASAGRPHRAPSRRSLQAARRPALRPRSQQPALRRCARHGAPAARVSSRAAPGPGRRRRRARPGAPYPARGAAAPHANGALLCEIGRGRKLLEAAFPRLPFLWLDTEQSEGEVFWITREDLDAWDVLRWLASGGRVWFPAFRRPQNTGGRNVGRRLGRAK